MCHTDINERNVIRTSLKVLKAICSFYQNEQGVRSSNSNFLKTTDRAETSRGLIRPVNMTHDMELRFLRRAGCRDGAEKSPAWVSAVAAADSPPMAPTLHPSVSPWLLFSSLVRLHLRPHSQALLSFPPARVPGPWAGTCFYSAHIDT